MQTQKALAKIGAAIALILSLGVANLHAQNQTVKMTISGTGALSATNLQVPNTGNNENNYTGNGNLGAFTYRDIRALTNFSQPTSTCSAANTIAFSSTVGAAVFRFQDGSLLKVNLTLETDCIDLAAGMAHCVLTYQVAGGTGRFIHASGNLTLTESVVPVLADLFGNPVFFAGTGEVTGTIAGVAKD
jgi:hypothetical protein